MQASQTTAHLLECQTLIDKCQDLFNDQAVQAEDIFSSDITRQKRATQLYKSVLDTKTKLEEILTPNGRCNMKIFPLYSGRS